ncbi:MAG: hypothetical protein KC615_10620 [Anaerolineae bacterium]|nr:hypothetical protein [Anaerolineae bacterium]
MATLNITLFPQNREHFARLLAFGQDVLDVCSDLKIMPILNASLAVFAYTQNREMVVNDIDMLIPEAEFGKLGDALTKHSMQVELKPYHVLRVLRDDLKIDFDSQDYWPPVWGISLSETHIITLFGKFQVKIMALHDLIRTYQVGALQDANRSADYQTKLKALERVQDRSE